MKKLLEILTLFLATITVNAQPKPVRTGDLPKSIVDNITKDYAGYTIRNATKDVTNNIPSFNVTVVKGMNQEVLVYDKDGKFIKRIESKKGVIAQKNKTSPTRKNINMNPQKNK